jgi:hypothetical protein
MKIHLSISLLLYSNNDYLKLISKCIDSHNVLKENIYYFQNYISNIKRFGKSKDVISNSNGFNKLLFDVTNKKEISNIIKKDSFYITFIVSSELVTIIESVDFFQYFKNIGSSYMNLDETHFHLSNIRFSNDFSTLIYQLVKKQNNDPKVTEIRLMSEAVVLNNNAFMINLLNCLLVHLLMKFDPNFKSLKQLPLFYYPDFNIKDAIITIKNYRDKSNKVAYGYKYNTSNSDTSDVFNFLEGISKEEFNIIQLLYFSDESRALLNENETQSDKIVDEKSDELLKEIKKTVSSKSYLVYNIDDSDEDFKQKLITYYELLYSFTQFGLACRISYLFQKQSHYISFDKQTRMKSYLAWIDKTIYENIDITNYISFFTFQKMFEINNIRTNLIDLSSTTIIGVFNNLIVLINAYDVEKYILGEEMDESFLVFHASCLSVHFVFQLKNIIQKLERGLLSQRLIQNINHYFLNYFYNILILYKNTVNKLSEIIDDIEKKRKVYGLSVKDFLPFYFKNDKKTKKVISFYNDLINLMQIDFDIFINNGFQKAFNIKIENKKKSEFFRSYNMSYGESHVVYFSMNADENRIKHNITTKVVDYKDKSFENIYMQKFLRNIYNIELFDYELIYPLKPEISLSDIGKEIANKVSSFASSLKDNFEEKDLLFMFKIQNESNDNNNNSNTEIVSLLIQIIKLPQEKPYAIKFYLFSTYVGIENNSERTQTCIRKIDNFNVKYYNLLYHDSNRKTEKIDGLKFAQIKKLYNLWKTKDKLPNGISVILSSLNSNINKSDVLKNVSKKHTTLPIYSLDGLESNLKFKIPNNYYSVLLLNIIFNSMDSLNALLVTETQGQPNPTQKILSSMNISIPKNEIRINTFKNLVDKKFLFNNNTIKCFTSSTFQLMINDMFPFEQTNSHFWIAYTEFINKGYMNNV